MSSPSMSSEVPLNERIAAVATVLCDGELHVINRDPFTAMIPPQTPGSPPILLSTFSLEPAETVILEASIPIATKVPSTGVIDDWAIRQAHDLFNVYVVREETGTDELGSVLKAQSSIIATNLTVPVLGIALGILSATAPGLASDYRERFTAPSALSSMSADSHASESRTNLPTTASSAVSPTGLHLGHVSPMPGYL